MIHIRKNDFCSYRIITLDQLVFATDIVGVKYKVSPSMCTFSVKKCRVNFCLMKDLQERESSSPFTALSKLPDGIKLIKCSNIFVIWAPRHGSLAPV